MLVYTIYLYKHTPNHTSLWFIYLYKEEETLKVAIEEVLAAKGNHLLEKYT